MGRKNADSETKVTNESKVQGSKNFVTFYFPLCASCSLTKGKGQLPRLPLPRFSSAYYLAPTPIPIVADVARIASCVNAITI